MHQKHPPAKIAVAVSVLVVIDVSFLPLEAIPFPAPEILNIKPISATVRPVFHKKFI
jgi:hypothetical protein